MDTYIHKCIYVPQITYMSLSTASPAATAAAPYAQATRPRGLHFLRRRNRARSFFHFLGRARHC